MFTLHWQLPRGSKFGRLSFAKGSAPLDYVAPESRFLDKRTDSREKLLEQHRYKVQASKERRDLGEISPRLRRAKLRTLEGSMVAWEVNPPKYANSVSASQRNAQPQGSHTLKSCHSEIQAWEKFKALGATHPIILQPRHHPNCTPIQKLSFIILNLSSQGVIKKMPRDSLDACTGFVNISWQGL